ncbi:hypothetical protein [Saccharothrix variisporea]|uniref:hypothetical protein n=1 Tax=Saccharothrix variisporea TaxID=543527 RepID=UPI0011C3E6F7|nr:hypothetical protein [Saccharothrix variisporea]
MVFTGSQPAPTRSKSRRPRPPRPEFRHRLPALLVCLALEVVSAHLDLPTWLDCAALLLRFVHVSALTRAAPRRLVGRVFATVVDELIGPLTTVHCGCRRAGATDR